MTERTLEDWIAYWTPSTANQTCRCSGDLQCASCTVKACSLALRELDASWRRTLAAERSSFHALRKQYETLKKRVADASNCSPA